MILAPLSFSQFAKGWLAAAAAVKVADTVAPQARLAEVLSIDLGGGFTLPLFTCLLGLVGVIAARFLARKQESTLSMPAFLLVTGIMLFVVELWIIESRPSALFSFVVAIGLGFSGYSLIELVGTEIRAFVSDIVSRARAAIGLGAKSKDTEA